MELTGVSTEKLVCIMIYQWAFFGWYTRYVTKQAILDHQITSASQINHQAQALGRTGVRPVH